LGATSAIKIRNGKTVVYSLQGREVPSDFFS
jgi:hypothetical protein